MRAKEKVLPLLVDGQQRAKEAKKKGDLNLRWNSKVIIYPKRIESETDLRFSNRTSVVKLNAALIV